ncbi:MAG: endonuclease/exonuclease/phosphatase family protein [Lentimicrobiaceae bacterium]|jgi:endonuclease/exonuclease/phosphatase family metal-dependent hydrolase
MNTSRIKNITRFSLYAALALSGLVLLFLAGFLLFATVTDYKPDEKETLVMKKSLFPDTIAAGRLEIYTWNIGYGGLGRKMDFFYENGKMVRPEKEYYKHCRDGIIQELKTLNKPDFIFLQEVDQQSHRTYLDNQVERLEAVFKEYFAFFALNYKVPFVPVPLYEPMGKVKAGLLTLSRYEPIEAERYSFPSSYSWPKRLFMLDRGFILTRFIVGNGKQLVLINTHNSAFSDAADMRAKELNMLKDIIEKEYSIGNYVIVGGDWNQNPLPFNQDSIQDGNKAYAISPEIPADFLPAGFTWAFDPRYPTNRNVDIPYTKGKTGTTIIDFFVLSPNIHLITTHTLQTNFEFSDHQPVGMVVDLK